MATDEDRQPLEKFLTVSDLETLGIGERSTIFRKYKAGKFPEPLYLMGRRVWRTSVIERWVAEELNKLGPVRPHLRRGTSGSDHDES